MRFWLRSALLGFMFLGFGEVKADSVGDRDSLWAAKLAFIQNPKPEPIIQEKLPFASEIPSTTQQKKSENKLEPPFSYWRFSAVGGLASSSMGGSYIFLQNIWWKEESKGFHLDDGFDLIYARNLDKLGHFYGGNLSADVFFHCLRWAGLSESKSDLYGGIYGTLVQVGIELKDGYAPAWGFSLWDVGAGSMGSFFPLLKRKVPFFANIDLKLSYYYRKDKYWEDSKTQAWIEDYSNQTYWFSCKVNNMLPMSLEPYWPDILAVAIGFSVDENTDYTGNGKLETYLALDYDVTKLFPTQDPFWNKVKHYLNYIKFPSPAMRIAPDRAWFGLYF